MKMRIYGPLSQQTAAKERQAEKIGHGGNAPRRRSGRIQPQPRFCIRCWDYCGGRCRIDRTRARGSKRLPVGKRRDKRGQRKPR